MCCLSFGGALSASSAHAAPSWERAPAQQRDGVFWREHWYALGLTNHNPGYERRLRVNPPEIVVHTNFGRRVEGRENGLMLIPAVKDYFTLNGKHFPAAEGTRHVPVFSRLPVEAALLRRGENTFELLSDTEHHGIEVLLPGPALMVRYRTTP